MRRFATRGGAFAALTVALFAGCSGDATKTVSGEVAFGPVKPVAGELWTVTLHGDGDKNYSGSVDAAGKFSVAKVPEGGYKVQVMHYLPTGDGKAKAGARPGAGAPQQFTYPETWAVPGGPYTLDLAKLKK